MNYPSIKNAPFIELGICNGIAQGFVEVERILESELEKYDQSSKEYLVLSNLQLQVELKRREEQQSIKILTENIAEAVKIKQLMKQQNEKKQPFLSRLFSKKNA